jgi:diguanylate cyclase (GGDEF)-like protein
MQSKGMLDFFKNRNETVSVTEFLEHSSYDELIEIDIGSDRYKFVYNVADKYHIPVTEGVYSEFYRYAADHLVHPDNTGQYADVMNPDTILQRLAGEELRDTYEFQFRTTNTSGGWRWVDSVLLAGPLHGLPDGIIKCYIFDIQNIKDREEGRTLVTRESSRILLDPLTGLKREKDYFYSVGEMLKAYPEKKWMMVVFDIEQFKMFNEWYGREAGDMVLARIGAGLRKDSKKTNGLAGYLGNDDFSMFVPAGSLQMEELFENLHKVIMRYGVSVGFLPAVGVSYSKKYDTVTRLYDEASLAMRNAKADFKNRIRYFDSSMYTKISSEYKLLSEFHSALKKNEITFYLQPQCRAVTAGIVGAEALARWVKPDGTMISPSVFVPVLEKYGFIPDLDKFIWEEVCRWLKSCKVRGLPLVPISVNVSAVDIFTFNVPEYIQFLAGKYHLPKKALKVEITESACADNPEKMREVVQELRKSGFMVLLDDFGSGYSSLNMLFELNIDVLKMDAHFLHMDEDTIEKGIHILEAIIFMAKSMRLPVIVEGVENQEQKEYLQSLGCQYVQGYYFYRPLTVTDFEKLIGNPFNIDEKGFVFIANEEFRVREFLNDAVYSDAMLNNILGPAAIYSWNKENVDIIRFNHKFQEAVDVPDFSERLESIQRFMPPADRKVMYSTLGNARLDKMNGASAVMNFGRIDGTYSRFWIHFYYLDEAEGRMRFYGSARDVTELTNLNRHMDLLSRFLSECVVFLIYHHGVYSYQVAAQGLEKEMQISREQLEQELNSGRFFSRIERKDRSKIICMGIDAVRKKENFTSSFKMIMNDGETKKFFLKSDFLEDETSDVKCILSVRCEQ